MAGDCFHPALEPFQRLRLVRHQHIEVLVIVLLAAGQLRGREVRVVIPE